MALDVPMVLPALPPLATCKLDVLRFQIPASQVGMIFVVFGVGSIKLTSASSRQADGGRRSQDLDSLFGRN